MILRLSLCAAAALSCAAPAWAQWTAANGGLASASLESVGAASPVHDAKGDAQDSFDEGPPLLDIDTVDMRYSADSLNFSVTFFTEIAPPDLGTPNGLVGLIQLDVDQSAATGETPLQNQFSPPFLSLTFGADYSVVMFPSINQTGTFAIVDSNLGNPIGYIPATFTPTSVSGSVPLSLIGDDDGLVAFTAIIGTVPQPTDALDVIGSSVPVPEPRALTLVGLASAFAGRRVRAARAGKGGGEKGGEKGTGPFD